MIVAAGQGLGVFLLNTLLILVASVLPIILLCALMLVIGRWMSAQLFKSFGWRGILFLAWLGTPVHELSHVLGCVIGRNQVTDFALFKPDKSTGSLGYVQHSYDKTSFYQRVIGNTVIAIAPFFGGALVIYLLTDSFYPQLLPASGEARMLDIFELAELDGLTAFFASWWSYLLRFISQLITIEHLSNWRFWLYVWAMISVAAHLSPSPTDFEGFWGPFAVLSVLVLLVGIILGALGIGGVNFAHYLQTAVMQLNSLLVAALAFLLLGAAIVLVLTSLWRLAR